MLVVADLKVTYQIATPAKNSVVAKVTMNGGIRSLAMQNPLNHPMPAPTATIVKIPAGMANGELANGPPVPVITLAPTTEVIAITAVIDRSIPAIIRMTVCPKATTMSGSISDRMF